MGTAFGPCVRHTFFSPREQADALAQIARAVDELIADQHAVNTRKCEAMKRSIRDWTTPAEARCLAPAAELGRKRQHAGPERSPVRHQDMAVRQRRPAGLRPA